MEKRTKTVWRAAIALVGVGLIGWALWPRTTHQNLPVASPTVGRSAPTGINFTLRHRGKPWKFSTDPAKLNLIYVGYAKCPDVCPMTLGYLRQSLRMLPTSDLEKLRVIFISVDAEHDNDDAVADYAQQFDSRFIGLTGSPEALKSATQRLGANYIIEDKPKSYLGYSIAHTDAIFFLNSQGDVIDLLESPRAPDTISQKIRRHL